MKSSVRDTLYKMAHTSKTISAVAVILTSVVAPTLIQDTTFAAVTTAPKNLRLVNAEGMHDCGLYTNTNYITPTWNAVPQATSYNYMVTLPDGSVNGPVNVGDVTSVSGPFGAEGTSDFSVQSVYEDGSTSEWAPPCSVTYDATKPVITTNITPGSALSGTVAITETVTESNPLAYSIRILDAAGNPVSVTGKNLGADEIPADGNSLSYDFVTTDVPDGAYKLQFSARDKAGNSETLVHDVSVDNTAPSITIDSYPTPVNDSTPTISGSVDDSNTSVRVTIGGATYTTAPNEGRWTITTDPLADNTYAISAVATDAAGNATTPPASGSVTIDTTPPSAVITNPINGSQAHGVIQISGNVSGAASYTLSINGTVVASGVTGDISYSWNTANLTSGTHSIVLSATDSASNTAQDSIFVFVDTMAPPIPMHTMPSNNAVGTSATINTLSWTESVDSSGPVSYTAQIATDAGFGNVLSTTNLTATSFAINATADGTYYWHVQACDSFGNCSDWSTATAFTIDNTAPVITVDESDSLDHTPTIKGTVNDPSAVVTIRVSGITYPTTVNSIPNENGTFDWAANVTENLRLGAHSITVFARDALGNNSVLGGAITITGTSAETNDAINKLATGASVLGNSAQTGVVSDKAATDTKEQAKSSSDSTNKLPGSGWWWLPLVVLLLGTAYYGYTYRINKG